MATSGSILGNPVRRREDPGILSGETQYFDDKAYLTQSGQLYMEAAAAYRKLRAMVEPRQRRRKAAGDDEQAADNGRSLAGSSSGCNLDGGLGGGGPQQAARRLLLSRNGE